MQRRPIKTGRSICGPLWAMLDGWPVPAVCDIPIICESAKCVGQLPIKAT